jgi:polyribonucleotide nucleotidyltransferase
MRESITLEVGGRELILETGEVAKQANGSVIARYGDQTVVLAAVTASLQPREGIDFFPLTCEFEEKMYAAGKIPGGYIKREGRPSEHGILSARQIDRPIRPLFTDGFRFDVQIITTVLSVDPKLDADVIATCAAGAALAVSDIPFAKNVASVRVGRDENGHFIINPTLEQYGSGGVEIVVAGTADAIMMVEGGAKEISEEDLLEAVAFAHAEIRRIVAAIDALAKKAGKPKADFPVEQVDPEFKAWIEGNFKADIAKAMRVIEKGEREAALAKLTRGEALERLGEKSPELRAMLEDPKSTAFAKTIKSLEETELRVMVVNEGIRPDGRKPDEIRPISSKVRFVPRVHGSGLFTRGQTQVFTAATLGSLGDEQRLDGILDFPNKRYMHYYNFPPYSTGETRPLRAAGRREIGHGYLAERALAPVLPDEESFPYTLRLVSEVLESNGSSSMASVCACTLALMDAGVPIEKHVAGVAMGLILHGDQYRVLTDIQGLEDSLGAMDFKVAGTVDGITAIQMDIKVAGITIEIMRDAMAKAKESRLFIIGKLQETIVGPRAELSPFAPRMLVLLIDREKIKDVIGPGGKIINKIIADTGVKIDIEDDGRIFISSPDGEGADQAKSMIEALTKDVKVGETYLGTVTRLMNFGAFVALLPGKEGLVHISQLAPGRIEKVEDAVKVGDQIMVKVMEIDAQNRINLSRKAVLGAEAPTGEGGHEAEPHPARGPKAGAGRDVGHPRGRNSGSRGGGQGG